jgi:hypothetical protein
MVGDASCSRYYKNGLESAFVTAQLAAETAFNSGISELAFQRGYWQKLKRTIIRDNLYGRLLFQVCDLASQHGILRQTYGLVAAFDREADPVTPLARQVLWDLFTGNVPYRTIFFRALNLRLQARLTITTLGLALERIRSLISGRSRGQTRRGETQESKR